MVVSTIHFLSNACHVCKTLRPKVTCELCGLVFYCTKDHRRLDWLDHSQFCRAIGKICDKLKRKTLFTNLDGMSAENYRSFRHYVSNECQLILGRPLESWEFEMIYYPKLCGVCLKSDDLKVCEGCNFTFTCSNRHFNKNHSDWCSILRDYSNIIQYLHNGGVFNMELPKTIDILPKSIHEILVKIYPPEEGDSVTIKNKFLSEMLTYPLTTLNGLRDVHLCQISELSLHFVGAEWQAEVYPLEKWEWLLLHLLPECMVLNLTFVGSELTIRNGNGLSNALDLCANCKKNFRKINYHFAPCKFYHDFMLDQQENPAPNMIFAFNCGLYRSTGFKAIDSWTNSINAMFSKNSPILITEYTEKELILDLNRCQKNVPNLKMVQLPTINPYASTKPGLNIISDDEVPVIFKNYYWAILSN